MRKRLVFVLLLVLFAALPLAAQTGTPTPSPTATTTPSATPTPGLPRLVELGSDSCAMCIAMQQVLAELRSNHPGRLEDWARRGWEWRTACWRRSCSSPCLPSGIAPGSGWPPIRWIACNAGSTGSPIQAVYVMDDSLAGGLLLMGGGYLLAAA